MTLAPSGKDLHAAAFCRAYLKSPLLHDLLGTQHQEPGRRKEQVQGPQCKRQDVSCAGHLDRENRKPGPKLLVLGALAVQTGPLAVGSSFKEGPILARCWTGLSCRREAGYQGPGEVPFSCGCAAPLEAPQFRCLHCCAEWNVASCSLVAAPSGGSQPRQAVGAGDASTPAPLPALTI